MEVAITGTGHSSGALSPRLAVEPLVIPASHGLARAGTEKLSANAALSRTVKPIITAKLFFIQYLTAILVECSGVAPVQRVFPPFMTSSQSPGSGVGNWQEAAATTATAGL